jgi:hypothetical protein
MTDLFKEFITEPIPNILVLFGIILIIFSVFLEFSNAPTKSKIPKLVGRGNKIHVPGVVLSILCLATGVLLYTQTATPSEVATPTPTSTSIFTILPTQTPSQTPTLIPTLTYTPTLTPIVCPYQRSTEDETITALIQAEAIAAQIKDMTIIQDIFDPNANFYDHSTDPPKEWHGAHTRYQEVFATVDFKEAKHFDILPVGAGISGDTATYTSGSQITYRVNGGDWIEQTNGSLNTTEFGSEHWILKKNTNGCWVIIQMEFNAGHIKFP